MAGLRSFVVLATAVVFCLSCDSGGGGGNEPDQDAAQEELPAGWDVSVPEGAGLIGVYVAGESIERRNRFVAPPFESDGSLNQRGGGEDRNSDDEYGWMVPMAQRLSLRAPDLVMQFVGSDVWSDADDMDYSGTYPSSSPGRTSAISGTDIPSWLEQRQGELDERSFCYQMAFVSRGGNDFGNDDDAAYQAALVGLVLEVDEGSNCIDHPIIYVTAHMPDDQRDFTIDDSEYALIQKHRFSERVAQAVEQVRASNPDVRVHFVDQFTPFVENQPTTAFPAEVWSTDGVPDYAKISRTIDSMHPRRLASIFVGEITADALNLDELRQVAVWE